MNKETEIVKIEKAIGRELTDKEFWDVGDRVYAALCNGEDVETIVNDIIRELKAA